MKIQKTEEFIYCCFTVIKDSLDDADCLHSWSEASREEDESSFVTTEMICYRFTVKVGLSSILFVVYI